MASLTAAKGHGVLVGVKDGDRDGALLQAFCFKMTFAIVQSTHCVMYAVDYYLLHIGYYFFWVFFVLNSRGILVLTKEITK